MASSTVNVRLTTWWSSHKMDILLAHLFLHVCRLCVTLPSCPESSTVSPTAAHCKKRMTRRRSTTPSTSGSI